MKKTIIIFCLIFITQLSAKTKYNYEFINDTYLQHESLLVQMAHKYGLPELLLLAIPFARENKQFNSKAISIQKKTDKYCYVGIWQERCKRSNKARIKKLQKVRYSCEVACKKLRAYINTFKIGNCDTDLDILIGLTAYQRGCAGARKYGVISNYAFDIYELWQELELLYIKDTRIK